MKKYLLGAAAAAFVVVGASSAMAAIVEGSDVCGELPNVKWTWVITTSTSTSGGETSTTIGDVSYNTQGNVGTAPVTTTTSAVIQTTTNICTAINPAGKENADHSTSTTSIVELSPATSSTTNQTVCNPGNSLPDCPL